MARSIAGRARGVAVLVVVTVPVVVTVLVVAGCATPGAEKVREGGALGAAISSTFMTEASGSVIERDGQTRLCFGVLQSNPPVCGGGVELSGWDWEAVEGKYEAHAGVRWGDFTVTGAYDSDAETLAVVSTGPIAATPTTDPRGPILPSRCPAPDGGWKIVDETRASSEALHAATGTIMSMEGFGTMWIDRSEIPTVPPGTDTLEEMRLDAVHAGLSILNVGVRSDPASAEERIRDVWGGALCVFSVAYTATELNARVQAIVGDPRRMTEQQIMTVGPDALTGVITVQVVHDVDGALQREMDQQYGPGAVVVSSILVPR
ncbi:hypothetical protein [Microbacterium sp. 179-I 3D3 NHS]|uniref:hypothetical protein n=1 Tax=Microbacterium sp. 179-I 3D3 NHS TaxID=3142382 RepID=UPI0039A14283